MEIPITEITSIMPMGNIFDWWDGLMGDVNGALVTLFGVIAVVITLVVSASGGWRVKAVLMGMLCGAGFLFVSTGGVVWFAGQLQSTITGAIVMSTIGNVS